MSQPIIAPRESSVPTSEEAWDADLWADEQWDAYDDDLWDVDPFDFDGWDGLAHAGSGIEEDHHAPVCDEEDQLDIGPLTHPSADSSEAAESVALPSSQVLPFPEPSAAVDVHPPHDFPGTVQVFSRSDDGLQPTGVTSPSSEPANVEFNVPHLKRKNDSLSPSHGHSSLKKPRLTGPD